MLQILYNSVIVENKLCLKNSSMKSNIKTIKLKGTLLLFVILGTLNIVSAKERLPKGAKEIRTSAFKYQYVLTLLDKLYVDTVNVEQITEKAIANTLEQLDPHSVYMNEKTTKEEEEMMSGEFSGIGIQFNILRDTLFVVSTIPGGPSEKVGLKAGDRILQVDDEKITNIGLTNPGVAKRLRGDKGTEVRISVKRENVKELLDFLIIRDDIPVHTVDLATMLSDKIGYVKINRFGQKTAKEFHEALVKLKKQNMKQLIIDLTGNGGGYLKAAVEILDEMLEDIKLTVYVQGRHYPRKDYMTLLPGLAEDVEVVVMINEGSASASEIVAGALQDWDRGVLVGRRSFGKGLVQNQFPLPDGSAVRVTTAHYYTPTGRNIQKSYAKGMKDYYTEIHERFKHGEMFNPDSINFPDSLKYQTLVNKRTVYGGGGIMPDVFVPMDTTKNYKYLNALYRKNIIFSYAVSYVDAHREELKRQYPDFESFKNNFVVTEKMLEGIVEAGKKGDVEFVEEIYMPVKEDLKLALKALLARSLWTMESYYELMITEDPILKKSIEILKENKINKILKNK